jgi:hypothetical protein
MNTVTRENTDTPKLTTADLAAASGQRVQADRGDRDEQRQARRADADTEHAEELAA